MSGNLLTKTLGLDIQCPTRERLQKWNNLEFFPFFLKIPKTAFTLSLLQSVFSSAEISNVS